MEPLNWICEKCGYTARTCLSNCPACNIIKKLSIRDKDHIQLAQFSDNNKFVVINGKMERVF